MQQKGKRSGYARLKSRAPFLEANCRIFLIAGPIFSTAFWTLHGSLFAFAKMHGPQGKCIMLYEIGIYVPKVAQ